VATHSTGHRMDHSAVFLEQAVCSECEQRSAVVRCQDCVDLYCYECFRVTHRAGKRLRHCVRLPFTTFCFECDQREAAYIVMESETALCPKCCSRTCRSGARQNHTIFGLRKAAYSKKLFADNFDRLMTILAKNLNKALPISPWFIFYDRSLAPFWYNFHTRELIRASPQDLVHPPASQVDPELLKDKMPLGDISGTNLLDTHPGRKAASTAVFHVPPPIHIKFASPAVIAGTLNPVMYDERQEGGGVGL